VASSDGHKGRPGASYPGPASFGAYGGLTCHQLPELNRDELFGHFRRRHHYATSGARIYLDTTVAFEGSALDEDENDIKNAQMGAILTTFDREFTFFLETVTEKPIEKIEIFDGTRCIKTIRTWGELDRRSKRLRLNCSGQEYRGRGRMVNWEGVARFSDGRIERLQPINFWNPDRQPILQNEKTVQWKTVTTGGSSGFDLWLDSAAWFGHLLIDTNQFKTEIDLQDLDAEILEFNCGGMDKRFSVQRLPEELTETHFRFEQKLELETDRERQIFTRITQEDGHQAWSSPIYLRRRR